MNAFSAAELTRMQSTQVAAMQDVCIIQSYSRTLDAYGAEVVTYTDASPVVCGVNMTAGQENRRVNSTVEHISATIRLPLHAVVKATDRIKVTYRYSSPEAAPIIYDIVGEIRSGPSGIQVDVLEATVS